MGSSSLSSVSPYMALDNPISTETLVFSLSGVFKGPGFHKSDKDSGLDSDLGLVSESDFSLLCV